MKQFCTKCGSPTQEGKKFCVNCGAPVPEGNTGPGKQFTPGPVPPAPQKKKGSPVLAVVLVILILIAAALAVVLFVPSLREKLPVLSGSSSARVEEDDGKKSSKKSDDEDEDAEEEDTEKEDKDKDKGKDKEDTEKESEDEDTEDDSESESEETEEESETEEAEFISGQESYGKVPDTQQYRVDMRTEEDYAQNVDASAYEFYDGKSRFSFYYPTQLYNYVLVDVTETPQTDYGINMQYIHFTGSKGSEAYYQFSQRTDNSGIDVYLPEIARNEDRKVWNIESTDNYLVQNSEGGWEGMYRLTGYDSNGDKIKVVLGVNNMYVFRMELRVSSYSAMSQSEQMDADYVLYCLDRKCVFSDDYLADGWPSYADFQASSYR